MLAAVVVGGRAIARRRAEADRLTELNADLERRKEADSLAAVEAERARIARELHDVVAHAVSVIVVQAQAAGRVLEGEQTSARESLNAIESTARTALVEMRRLLEMLRPEDEGTGLVPQPGLDQLGALVSQVREAGLDVDLRVEGERRAVPAGVDLSAFRIVQEALTNVLKHAGPARAEVTLRYHPGEIELEVVDDGAAAPRGRPGTWPPGDARAGRGRGRTCRNWPASRNWLRRPRLAAHVSIRIVIADDQELVRTGFRKILESEPGLEVVAEAADGGEAVEAVLLHRPHVVLMDVRMPRLDGIEATREVSGIARVLIVTTFDLDEYVFEAIRAGASGFLLKDAPADELIRAIRVVAEGQALLAPSVTRRLVEEFARRPRPAERPAAFSELTPRELEVLGLLARGLSNVEIAAELVVGDATVKTHVARILQKLGLRDRVQAVVLAYEAGLVQPGSL